MFHNAGGASREKASTATVSKKVNILSAAVAVACMLCGAASLSAGAVGVIAAVPLAVFASVACAMLFSFSGGVYRFVPALCALCALAFGIRGALFCVLAILCGACVALCIASRRKRFETVLWLTMCVCAVLCAFLAVSVAESYGDASRDSFDRYISALSEKIENAYLDGIKGMEEVFEVTGAMTEDKQQRLDRLSSADQVEAISSSVIISVPAYVAAAISILCYGMFSVFLMMANKAGQKLFAFRIYAVPPFLSHVYVICSFATFFISAKTVFGLGIFYVTVLLTPCFVYVGLRGLGALIRSGAPAGLRIGAVVMLIFLIPMFSYLIKLLAFLGAYVVMRSSYERRIIKKQ
ncbi:MAG: hypothetical protein IJN63_03035 [Clostridia bacterium]|nr:hypothetical protein [Clostridia bacterium]